MRYIVLIVLVTGGPLGAQMPQGVTAGLTNLYLVDAPAAGSLGMSSPIQVSTYTDSPSQMNIQTMPASFPVVMVFDHAAVLGNSVVINAWNNFNIQIDVRDRGGNGYAGDQILFSGYTHPSPGTWTNAIGQLTATAMVPSCTGYAATLNCITNPNLDQFEVSTQAVVVDMTYAPFNLRSTPCVQGTFDNGYEEFVLNDNAGSGEDYGVFTFLQGFTFTFYSVTYTQAYVSSNGHVSFGAPDTSFPNPSVSSIVQGVPRIMSYYTDLVPEGMPYPSTRVYARQFKDANGVTKVKFVHDHLAEFGNATGPHGGEIIITDNDDIAVFVPNYQAQPSINTGIGITPGNGVDSTVTGFGVDLSVRYGTLFAAGPGKSAFELFVPAFMVPPTNVVDLYGFANVPGHPVGPGVVFLKDTTLPSSAPSNSGYIIQ